MKTIGCLLGVMGLLVTAFVHSASGGEKKDEAIRELELKGFRFERKGGMASGPIVIQKEEDLKNLEGAAELQEFLGKSVDFGKRQVLIFAWSGSGRDRLSVGKETVTEKGGEVTFVYSRGLTRDLRHHLKAFSLPRGATWKVETEAFKKGI